MQERGGNSLSRSDGLRVKGAVKHVETLSRETVNVTAIPRRDFPTTAETVAWPIHIYAGPPSGSDPVLSVCYLGIAYIPQSGTWLEVNVLVRPLNDDVDELAIGMQGTGVLIDTFRTPGDYENVLIFTMTGPRLGCGIVYNEISNTWEVDVTSLAGPGLVVNEDSDCPAFEVDFPAAETLGCGLSRDGGDLHVNLTEVVSDGITWNSELCALSWRPGCGMTVGVSPLDGETAIAVNFDTLAGDNATTGLVVDGEVPVEIGDPCPSLAIDTVVFFTTDETLVTGSALSVVAGKIRLTLTKVTYTNHFNEAGILIDRTADEPATSYADTDICTIVACCSAEELTVECTKSGSGGEAPYSVDFTATPSGGVPPYTYEWSFDDGFFSTDQNPTHEYVTAGTYGPSVDVTDSCGNVVTCTVGGSIVVTAPPPTPGLTCADAGDLPIGPVQAGNVRASGTEDWWTFTVPAGFTTCTVTFTNVSGTTLFATAVNGTCAGLTTLDTIIGGTSLVFSSAGAPFQAWVRIIDTAGATNYDIQVVMS